MERSLDTKTNSVATESVMLTGAELFKSLGWEVARPGSNISKAPSFMDWSK
jgi:hypothetical protein